jgi:co-chaperonin GroES (HSP10)
MSFPINLIGELLVVKPEPIQGPIRLPDWKRSLSGIVLAVGPQVRGLSVGAKVFFGAAVGMDSVYAGQEIRILKEQDIDFVYEA